MDLLARTAVGRTAGRASLDAALDALAQGRGGSVAVEGEPGIGKTRLLGELRRRAEERGFLVLTGTATEFEQDLPFGVFTDALDAYVASQELDLPDQLRAELGALLPAVSAAGATPAGGGLADERYRVHRAVRSLLERLAAGTPLVL